MPLNICVLFSDALTDQLFSGLRTSVAESETQSLNICDISVTLETSQLAAPPMLVREEARENIAAIPTTFEVFQLERASMLVMAVPENILLMTVTLEVSQLT